MSEGLNPVKKHWFTMSKAKECLPNINPNEIHEQLQILASHVDIVNPTRKSARLVRNMSDDTKAYLKSDCLFKDNGLEVLMREIAGLID